MNKPLVNKPVILRDHIWHKSGKAKTVCVTACLTALGVPVNAFQVTGTLAKPNYLPILNKAGYCVRSRMSKMPKNKTIGACRKAISKLNEEALYFVIVRGNGYCHAMLLNNDGLTIVDTDPRKKDKRKVWSIHAVFKA